MVIHLVCLDFSLLSSESDSLLFWRFLCFLHFFHFILSEFRHLFIVAASVLAVNHTWRFVTARVRNVSIRAHTNVAAARTWGRFHFDVYQSRSSVCLRSLNAGLLLSVLLGFPICYNDFKIYFFEVNFIEFSLFERLQTRVNFGLKFFKLFVFELEAHRSYLMFEFLIIFT